MAMYQKRSASITANFGISTHASSLLAVAQLHGPWLGESCYLSPCLLYETPNACGKDERERLTTVDRLDRTFF